MKILLIDNYDSFTYNLVHYLEAFDCEVTVWRNDQINMKHVDQFDKVVISPGPGLPVESNQLNDFLEEYFDKKPILGVCLGFQAIVEHLGGQLYNQNEVKHGISENCKFQTESKLFKRLPETFKIGLYHSWAAEVDRFPATLKVTATSEKETIMAFEHYELPVCGVQFHPESIMTEHGKDIVNNFICNFG